MRSRFGAFGSPNGLFRSQSNKDIDKRNSMGNASSLAEETSMPAGPQRLTKPRTNTNSAYTGVSRKDSDSNKSTPSKPSSRCTNRAGDEMQFDAAESPFSFTNDSSLHLAVPVSENVYSNGSPSTSAPNLVNDFESPSPSARSLNRHSVAVDGSDIDIGAAIALLQQLKKNASPEDLVALHKALLPTRSVDLEVTDTILEAREPEEVVSPLIRRSSLLPAGLATRISLEAIKRRTSRKASQDRRRRSGSQVPRGRESGTWEQFVEGGFDAIDSAGKRVVNRTGVATPSDFDVTHIGNYQLGSLRVTNGAASPEPSLILDLAEQAASVRTTSGSAAGDGFVTADEGDISIDPVYQSQGNLYGSAPSPRVRASAPPNPGAGSFESRAMPKTRHTAPLKVDTGGDGHAHRATSRPSPRQRASDIAQDYMAECELAVSPYTDGAPLAAHISRLSTVEDNSPVDKLFGGPADALKKLNGTTGPNRSRQTSGGSDSSASRHSMDDRTYLQAPRRPSMQVKTDSGYSSETSWQQAQAKAYIRGASVDDELNSGLATANPSDVSLPTTASSSRPSMDDQTAAMAITTSEARPSPQPQRSERHASLPVSGSTSASASKNTLPTTGASASEEKPVKVQKQHKKLQKARPQPQQQPAVQPLKETKAEPVPVVPDIVSVNFSRRLVQRPDMSHLDQTFTSVDQIDHKDNTANEDEGRGRGRQPKSSADAETPKTEKRKSFLGRLRSRSRSKSQHRRPNSTVNVDAEPMPVISDFGSVAQSLGGSPYDIATRQSVRSRQSLDGSRPRFHPHEITSDFVRPAVNMDDETAAEYARSKSRDIAEQQAEERRARSQSRSRRHVVDQAIPATNSRPKHKRSVSAHPSIASRAPVVPEHKEVPVRPQPVRVGTIKFDGGEAQGRLSPTPTERPRNKRRTQSVSPRVRHSMENAENMVPSRAEVPQMPQLSSTASSIKDVVLRDSPASPVKTSTHPGWEDQARLWRERKMNVGATLTPASEKRRSLTGELVTPVSESAPSSPMVSHRYTPTKQSPRHSPAIVISRYVTPTSAELEAHLGSIKGEDPYATYHAPNPTAHLPMKEDVDRTDSAISSSAFTSTASYNSYSSTSSRPYRPYRPADAVSMTQLVSPQQQQPGRGHSRAAPRRSQTAPTQEPVFDRYSGGMGYGWERGNGFGGSAGTRQGSDQAAKRKSVQLSESFGVDLSDVPVFMTKG